jgi:hypothetical protein
MTETRLGIPAPVDMQVVASVYNLRISKGAMLEKEESHSELRTE